MTQNTFYWYDYETFGLDTFRDRPAQFAGARTTLDFQPVQSPEVFYCKPSHEYLPSVMACVLTGITPQFASHEGMDERSFAGRVFAALNKPGTISVGYNSIGFDDKVNRALFWRNLLEPYTHSWANGCSRWDLYPFVLAVWALRPDGINWPVTQDEEGNQRQTFKLEKLTAANGITHSHAHDAASDVEATIGFAKLLAQSKPRLWKWAFMNRGKHKVLDALATGRPCLWVDPRAGQQRGFLRFVMPVAKNPGNQNEVFVWDCREDPQPLTGMTPEEIARRAFGPAEMLAEGESRLPLRGLRVNDCPFVCEDLRVATPAVCERFGLNMQEIIANGEKLTEMFHLIEGPVQQALQLVQDERKKRREEEGPVDAESALYEGFVNDPDRKQLQRTVNRSLEDLAQDVHEGRLFFEDERLNTLLFRMRARCAPETLDEKEAQQWLAYCRKRLTQEGVGKQTLEAYFEELDAVRDRYETMNEEGALANERFEAIEETLNALYAWGEQAADEARLGDDE